MSQDTTLTPINWNGHPTQIETRWVGRAPNDDSALIIFLHEGLGSVAMWRDFPQSLCDALGVRGLVYSRPGYGRSDPRRAEEKWRPDFMHRQANEVLPALMHALEIDAGESPVWLFGHSDGGTIALLHAARYADIRGAIVLAPHLFVEQISVDSIQQARVAYEQKGLKEKLARYHAHVDSAFYGWNDIWLDPAFRNWNIEADIAGITQPVLAIQGVDDEYGTMAQIERIQALVPQTELLKLENCGHSPHKDQPDKVIGACKEFLQPSRPPAAPTGDT